MSEDFDPYYKWLAIPPSEQPPNHYRLLGVPLYIDDPDVIENAADQRMSYLRSFQAGRYSQDSQRLLNEVATARICLLNRAKRTDYDAALRRQLQPVITAAPTPLPVQPELTQPMNRRPLPVTMAPQPVVLQQPSLRPIPLPPPVPPPLGGDANAFPASNKLETAAAPTIQSRQSKRKSPNSPLVEVFKHIAASAAGLLCGYLLIAFFAPSWDHFHLFHRQPVAVNPPAQPPANLEPVTRPPKIEPPAALSKANDPPQRQEWHKEPPVDMLPPEKPPPPAPTAEELARKAEAERQARLEQLQTDRDAAVAAGQVAKALKLTAEFAELKELDPQQEQARVIDELRKVEHPPTEALVLTGALLQQARDALENDRKELAAEQATAALQLARKTSDQDLIRQATRLILEIKPRE